MRPVADGSLFLSVFRVTQVVGVCSREYIPKGTRFGPLVGEIYTAESVPQDANRKYFWRVSRRSKHTHAFPQKPEGPLPVTSKVSQLNRKHGLFFFFFCSVYKGKKMGM